MRAAMRRALLRLLAAGHVRAPRRMRHARGREPRIGDRRRVGSIRVERDGRPTPVAGIRRALRGDFRTLGPGARPKGRAPAGARAGLLLARGDGVGRFDGAVPRHAVPRSSPGWSDLRAAQRPPHGHPLPASRAHGRSGPSAPIDGGDRAGASARWVVPRGPGLCGQAVRPGRRPSSRETFEPVTPSSSWPDGSGTLHVLRHQSVRGSSQHGCGG